MISFTLKGKNSHPEAKYWWPHVYYYENTDIKYTNPTDATNIIPITQTTVHFSNVPANVGFGVGFYRTQNIEDIIIDPYMAATTDLFVLRNNASYILDFHSEVGIPTLTEEEAPPEKWEFPLWLPWEGPPLPKNMFPPWPWHEE